MKVIVFIAILALAWAAEDKKAEKPEEKKEEKKEEERRGLQWPMPDWRSEGDLIQHGVHFYERVGELRKLKLENDMDKMILAFGRNFLRKAHKYLEATPDFKVLPVFCHDSRAINSTHRWEIRLHPEQNPVEQQNNQENKPAQGEQQPKQQNDAPAETPKTQNDAPISHPKGKPIQPDQKPNASNENATDAPAARPDQQQQLQSYQAQRVDHYRRMGDNFARLLLKHYRKEILAIEETEYINHWSEDEAIHYGAMGIYCHDGENVKEIVKKMNLYIEEKVEG